MYEHCSRVVVLLLPVDEKNVPEVRLTPFAFSLFFMSFFHVSLFVCTSQSVHPPCLSTH